MPKNCDSLFKTGDKGQRYEVRAVGMHSLEFVVGWTERADGGGLVKMVEKHPVWTLSRIVDRDSVGEVRNPAIFNPDGTTMS